MFCNRIFFQNEEIFIQLHELDELDEFDTNAWIAFNDSLTQAQKTF